MPSTFDMLKGRHEKILAVVALLFLTACGPTPQEKLAALHALPAEEQFVNFFSNNCVATAAVPAKISDKMARIGMLATIASPASLTKIHFKNDEAVQGWGVFNPVNAHHYGVIVTRKGMCVAMDTKLDPMVLRAKFTNYVNAFASSMKTEPISVKAPDFPSAQVLAYHINLPNLAVGPELSVIIQNPPSDISLLLISRLTVQPAQ